jgi:hypothetical protein
VLTISSCESVMCPYCCGAIERRDAGVIPEGGRVTVMVLKSKSMVTLVTLSTLLICKPC